MIEAEAKPQLLFFYSPTSGRARRIEGFLAQVLQRSRNHDTFVVRRIDVAARPDLAERFRIRDTPAILVVEGNKVAARSMSPKNCTDLTKLMSPWLR